MTFIGKINFVFAAAIVTTIMSCAASPSMGASPVDSTKATLVINPRLHSSGYFPFTGALLNNNPVADVNVFYEKKSLGFFVFQSLDLVDRHSYVNYLQPGVFATFKFHPSFRVRTFFGYIFSQTQGFRDADSDYYTAAMAIWDISKRFRIENTLLFYDITIQKKIADRLLLSWSSKKFKTEVYVWHRAVLEENKHAVSMSLSVTYPMIKLSKKTTLQFSGAYFRYLTEYRPSFALKDGFIFTVAVPVNVLP